MAVTNNKQKLFVGTLDRFNEKYSDVQVKLVDMEQDGEVHFITFIIVPFKLKREHIFNFSSRVITWGLTREVLKNTSLLN